MQSFISPSQCVAYAAHLARIAHADQRYGDAPYMTHVRAVASVCQIAGERTAAVGYLHDVCEDSDMTPQDLRAAGFDSFIAASVELLTRPAGMRYHDYIERFGEFPYTDGMLISAYDTAYEPAYGQPMARIVKLADNLHHTSFYRLGAEVPADKRSLYDRYMRAQEALVAMCNLELVETMTAHMDRLVARRLHTSVQS